MENSDSVKFDDIERIVTSVVDSLRNETETSLISEAVKMKGRAGVDVSQAISKIVREFTSSWDEKNKKHHLVCGKDVLSRVNAELKTKYNVSFTKIQLVDSMLADELPADLREAIVDIDNFIRS